MCQIIIFCSFSLISLSCEISHIKASKTDKKINSRDKMLETFLNEASTVTA